MKQIEMNRCQMGMDHQAEAACQKEMMYPDQWMELSGTARRGKILADFLSDEEGVGVIEIVLILVVLIGLVIIFKNQLNTLLGNIFRQIESLSESVY